ncbi:MAG: rhomboid family intramembrane serine protease [Paramuribaculum sp.]|nr:rhomboid family intramembrane serine protease [Paramuribaculum sp.]
MATSIDSPIDFRSPRFMPVCLSTANLIMFVVIACCATFVEAPRDILSPLWLELGNDGMPSHALSLVTYMFVHIHPVHLVFNLLWLLIFGICRDPRIISGKSLCLIYLAGGIAGAVAYIMIPDSGAGSRPLVGASAAVLSVVTAVSLLCPRKRINLPALCHIRLLYLGLAVIGLHLLNMKAGGFPAPHVAGIATGVVYAGWVRFAVLRRHSTDTSCVVTSPAEASASLNSSDIEAKLLNSGYMSLNSEERAMIINNCAESTRPSAM